MRTSRPLTKRLQEVHDRSDFVLIPPLENTVARVYLKRGFHLLMRFRRSSKKASMKSIDSKSLVIPSDVFPAQRRDGRRQYQVVRMDTWPMMAEAYARLKQPDKAREVLAQISGSRKAERAE